jgi:hypothetical protein
VGNIYHHGGNSGKKFAEIILKNACPLWATILMSIYFRVMKFTTK